MNIFILDENPVLAAKWHCDKHVVKMILESGQLLCTAHHMLDGKDIARSNIKGLLQPTHENHPCAVWTRASRANYFWLHSLMRHLLREYTARYGKVHKFDALWAQLVTLPRAIKHNGLTDFAQCVQYRDSETGEYIDCSGPDAVAAYREYYVRAKRRFATWKEPAVEPVWFTCGVARYIGAEHAA